MQVWIEIPVGPNDILSDRERSHRPLTAVVKSVKGILFLFIFIFMFIYSE